MAFRDAVFFATMMTLLEEFEEQSANDDIYSDDYEYSIPEFTPNASKYIERLCRIAQTLFDDADAACDTVTDTSAKEVIPPMICGIIFETVKSLSIANGEKAEIYGIASQFCGVADVFPEEFLFGDVDTELSETLSMITNTGFGMIITASQKSDNEDAATGFIKVFAEFMLYLEKYLSEAYPYVSIKNRPSLLVLEKAMANLTVDDEADKMSPSLFQDTGNIHGELQGSKKISVSKKKTFLQETFELLKEDYLSNGKAILDIIGKMAKLDCDCAVGMWKYLIDRYPEVLHGFYDFGYLIMNTIEQAVGREKVYQLLTADAFLKNAIFSELGDMQYSPIQAIRFYVFSGQTEIANELLMLSYNNKYRRTSFFEILDGILNNYYDERLGDDGFEMLMGWIAKVEGKQERAKLNLAMLNYMEEE